MTDKIKIFDFSITAQEAKEGKCVDVLISKLRPDWPKGKIRNKVFSGGQVNCMINYYNEDDKNVGIVVRIYGGLGDQFTDRDTEVMCMQLAYHQKCFPEIFAFFENGIAYAFNTGRMLSIKEFEKPDIARRIARAMCDFHNADVKQIPLIDRHGHPATFNTSFHFYADMTKIISDAPEQLSTNETRAAGLTQMGVTREVVLKEIEKMEKLFEPLNLPKAITHYDYHQRNGIYDDKTGQLIILDLEMVKMGYEAFDIGGLFVEGPWRRLVPDFYDVSGGEPAVYTEELKRLYAREYSTRKYEIQKRDLRDVTADVIQLQYLENEIAAAVFHLFWIVTFVACMDFKEGKLPVTDMMQVEWDLYRQSMKEFPEVKKQYLSQRAKVESQQK